MGRYMVERDGRYLIVDQWGKTLADLSTRPAEHRRLGDVQGFETNESFTVRDVLGPWPDRLAAAARDTFLAKDGGYRICGSWHAAPDADPDPGERVAAGDTWGLVHFAYLVGLLRGIYPESFENRDLGMQIGDSTRAGTLTYPRDCNLCLFGGPLRNEITRDLAEALNERSPGRLRYWFDGNHAIVDTTTEHAIVDDAEFYDPESKERPKRDGALLARLPNVMASEGKRRIAWVFAGCRAWGTLAALDAMSNERFQQKLLGLAAEHEYFQIALDAEWDDRGAKSQPWPDRVYYRASAVYDSTN